MMISFLERPLKNGVLLKERYKLFYFIGKGSYGLAYRAIDQLTMQQVIIKQARSRKKKKRAGLLEREAATLLSLDHPAIPSCMEYFEENKQSFLVMEAKKGENLEDLIFRKGKKFTEKDSLEFLFKIVKIVQYIHDQQLIHRDLRLPNILFDEKEVSVIDFGLAARLGEKHNHIFTSVSVEKRLYHDISVKSDYYALGHLLLFLLYSTYNPTTNKERSWEEELTIHPKTKRLIKKLLQLDHDSYKHGKDIMADIQSIVDELRTKNRD